MNDRQLDEAVAVLLRPRRLDRLRTVRDRCFVDATRVVNPKRDVLDGVSVHSHVVLHRLAAGWDDGRAQDEDDLAVLEDVRGDFAAPGLEAAVSDALEPKAGHVERGGLLCVAYPPCYVVLIASILSTLARRRRKQRTNRTTRTCPGGGARRAEMRCGWWVRPWRAEREVSV